MTTAHPYTNEAARRVAITLRERYRLSFPRVAIILGSGLGGLVHEIDEPVCIPFNEIPGFPDTTVRGHAGELVVGTLRDVPIAVLAGRFHLYEGFSPALVGFPVRVVRALGARTLLITNASGGINRSFAPGDMMVVEDHINLMGPSPLTGPQDHGDVRFPDMSEPYDPELRDRLILAAESLKLPLKRGVYAGVYGPSYETRAEIRMLERMGADAVGMSTVPEVITARALAMRVCVLSCITNMAAGVQSTPLDHADVLLTTSRVADQFQALVKEFASGL